MSRGRSEYTDSDKVKFSEALKLYGKDWKEVSKHVGTKTLESVRCHFYQTRKALLKEPCKYLGYDEEFVNLIFHRY